MSDPATELNVDEQNKAAAGTLHLMEMTHKAKRASGC
jgi:hypothetical protein